MSGIHPAERKISAAARPLTSRTTALAAGLLSAALALAARLLWPFDGLYGQDAFAYARYAEALWPHLTRGAPLPIYLWPAGYPLLVAALLPLFGAAAGQVVSVLSAAATAALTALLTWELLPDAPGQRAAALFAGLSVACCGALLRASLVVMADAAATACCALALYAALRYARSGRGGWLIAAALALGYATITRWVCGLLIVPLLVVLVYQPAETAPQRNEETKDTKARGGWTAPRGRGRRWHITLALLALVLLVVPQVLVSQRTPVALSQHQWLTAWSVAHAWQRVFTTVDGTQRYDLPVGLYNTIQLWRLAPLGPIGVVALWRVRQWPLLALLGGWPCVLLIFLSGIPYQNARFVLPALPALAALGGLGFGWLWAAGTSPRRNEEMKGTQNGFQARTSLFALLTSLAALTLLGSVALGARDLRRLVAAKDDQLALAAWVTQRLPPDAALVTFGPTLLLQRYTALEVRELFYLTPPDLDALAAQRRTYLLLDVSNIEAQWAGLGPQQNLRHLQPALTNVDRRGAYTLFAVKEPRR